MTLHQMRIFESVARHLNVTIASDELCISQPAVSHQLKLLEEECGIRLYTPTKQGIVLTKRGQMFLESIRPVLMQVEAIKERFKNSLDLDQRSGVLVVGGSRNVSLTLLPEVLTAFKRRHCEIQLKLVTDNSRAIEDRILNSAIDIALVTNPSYSSQILYEPFAVMKVVAFTLPTSPLVNRRLSLRQLADAPLVLRSSGKIFEHILQSGCKVNVALECQMSQTVLAAVKRGMGVGILYRGAVESSLLRNEVRILDVPELNAMEVTTFIIHDKRIPLRVIAQDFLKLLRERVISNSRSEADEARCVALPPRSIYSYRRPVAS
jgi:LysR family transcriptional regulator, low CO2-responsive transcriptional regulator